MKVTAATTESCFGEEQAWPPGFRFHPTDEELVLYYLKRKICGRKLKLDIIRETDVYKWNPEDLPEQAILKNGDRQWFFFSPRDRKYPNAARSNRATGHGYWKATGKDRPVTCNSRTVGVKKTLVFYRGRAPKGERTDWVMHEYTVDEEELKKWQNVKDYYALYKLYKKSGPGPKNGEQYGAPFKEEEWADEEYSSKPVDAITPVKQSNEAIPNDNVELNDQILFPSNDIEEFMRQFADDEPPLPQPQAHFDYILPRATSEEEIQSAFLDPSVPNHVEQTPQICKEDYLDIEDYLEMDDILNSDTLISNVEKPVEGGQQFNELDGIGEIDLYFDASTFLQDTGPTGQGTVPFPYAENMINHVSYMLEPQSNISLMDLQLEYQSNTNLMDQQLQPELNATGVDNQLQLQPNTPWNNQQVQSQLNTIGVDNQLQLQPNTPWNNQQVQSQLNTIGDNQLLHPQLNAFGDNILNLAGYQSHSLSNNLTDQQFIPNSTVGHVDYQLQFQPYRNELEQQLPTDEINCSTWTHDQSGDVFTPPGSNLGNASPTSGLMFDVNSQEEGENGGGASRFSSALWSFVDSIPTTPASAAESPLVNRAFERMSSFSKLRINAKIATASAVNGGSTPRKTSRNKGFFLISSLGALCAILWFLVGMVRVLRSSISPGSYI